MNFSGLAWSATSGFSFLHIFSGFDKNGQGPLKIAFTV